MRHFLNVGLLFGMAAVLVTSGCATSGGGASDSDQIGVLLGEWKAAILAEDADRLLGTFSDDFSHDGSDYDAKDKAALKGFIEWGIEGDRYKDAEIDIEGSDIVIEEGTATVYPIAFANWEGSVTIEMTLAKEEAGWLITDMAVEGM